MVLSMDRDTVDHVTNHQGKILETNTIFVKVHRIESPCHTDFSEDKQVVPVDAPQPSYEEKQAILPAADKYGPIIEYPANTAPAVRVSKWRRHRCLILSLLILIILVIVGVAVGVPVSRHNKFVSEASLRPNA